MYALIMAGGAGSRLNLGEKALVRVRDRPMISYVIDAFQKAGFEPVVVLSPRTPYTSNWCRVHGITCIPTSGAGYVEDLADAVEVLEVQGPLFTCVADIPCITSGLILRIYTLYTDAGTEACSVWVPLSIAGEAGRCMYTGLVEGVEACPAGVNIIRGDCMGRPQEETPLLIADRRLVFNINTREELKQVSALMKGDGSGNASS